jgi:hypothetical protein
MDRVSAVESGLIGMGSGSLGCQGSAGGLSLGVWMSSQELTGGGLQLGVPDSSSGLTHHFSLTHKHRARNLPAHEDPSLRLVEARPARHSQPFMELVGSGVHGAFPAQPHHSHTQP